MLVSYAFTLPLNTELYLFLCSCYWLTLRCLDDEWFTEPLLIFISLLPGSLWCLAFTNLSRSSCSLNFLTSMECLRLYLLKPSRLEMMAKLAEMYSWFKWTFDYGSFRTCIGLEFYSVLPSLTMMSHWSSTMSTICDWSVTPAVDAFMSAACFTGVWTSVSSTSNSFVFGPSSRASCSMISFKLWNSRMRSLKVKDLAPTASPGAVPGSGVHEASFCADPYSIWVTRSDALRAPVIEVGCGVLYKERWILSFNIFYAAVMGD